MVGTQENFADSGYQCGLSSSASELPSVLRALPPHLEGHEPFDWTPELGEKEERRESCCLDSKVRGGDNYPVPRSANARQCAPKLLFAPLLSLIAGIFSQDKNVFGTCDQ
jgi:hypothetical protein